MDGVTILNTYMGLTHRDMVFLTIYAVLVGGIGIILLIVAIAEESSTPAALGIFALCAVMAVCKFYYPRTEHIQATVDPSVSWTELTERYEIVKTEGRIVTMIKRRQEDETDRR